jgi:hypothetical protein
MFSVLLLNFHENSKPEMRLNHKAKTSCRKLKSATNEGAVFLANKYGQSKTGE